MRPEQNKTIEAVIEVCSFDDEPLWPLSSDPPFSFLRLHSGITSDEVGMVMHTACAYGHEEIPSSITETLESFLSQEGFVMPGGLQFVEDGIAKVVPGCCCGLENWREWLDVPYGKKYIWAGHDPMPSVEYFDNGIRIWQDEKSEETSFIEFTQDEMESLLRKTETDLRGFLVQLEKWTAYIAPDFEQRLVPFFAKHIHI